MNAFELIAQSLRNYADLRGCASRSEFWTFFFFVLVAQVTARLIDVILVGGSYIRGPIAMLTGVSLFVPQVSVAVRRLHDVNRSGRALLVPCLLVIASPSLVLFGNFPAKIMALGYAAVTLLMFGQLLTTLARKGSVVPNRYSACPTAFSFGH